LDLVGDGGVDAVVAEIGGGAGVGDAAPHTREDRDKTPMDVLDLGGGVSALRAALNLSVVFRRPARAVPAVWASRGRRTWPGSPGVTMAIAWFEGRAVSSTRSCVELLATMA
jgi:hypothetical protein